MVSFKTCDSPNDTSWCASMNVGLMDIPLPIEADRAAIVEHHDVSNPPAVPVDIFCADCLAVPRSEHCVALLVGHPLDRHGINRIDEQARAAVSGVLRSQTAQGRPQTSRLVLVRLPHAAKLSVPQPSGGGLTVQHRAERWLLRKGDV